MNKLVLQVLADVNPMIKGLNQAQSQLDQLMKSAERVGGSLGGGVNRALDSFTKLAGGGANAAGVLAGAFVAASTAAFAMTVQAGKIAEETEQLAQKTGIAAVSLEGMSVALTRNNLASNSIALAMKGLSKEMLGVSQGTASSTKLFQSMGVSLDAVERGTGATLRAIADAFQKMPAGAEKARFATELFGKAGLDLIPILNQGAAGLDAAMKKSAEFGLILTDTARSDLTVFDDAMDDLGSALKGFGMQVGAAFAPSLTILVKAFTDVIVFTKDVFNQFADAAEKLSIRLGAMVAVVQIVGSQLFSLTVLSKEAWQETLAHVKAIDQWAASQLEGVDASRAASQELDQLAIKHLDAANSVEAHASSQERLGQQIVAATKIQLAQIDALGKQQERMGSDIVSGAKVTLQVEADAGKEQEALGRTINRNFAASQDVAQQWVDAYMVQEDAAMARFQAEMDAIDRNEEAQGRFIVQQSLDAQKLGSFWTRSLEQIEQAGVFAFGSLRASFGNAVAGMIQGTATFTQFMSTLYTTILSGAVQLGINLLLEWGRSQLAQLALTTATEAAKTAATATGAATRTAITQAEAIAEVGIMAGAHTSILAFFATVSTALKALFFETLLPAIIGVGNFVIGVLTAIGTALGFTGFGALLAGGILAGVALITAALAATGNLGFMEGGIGDFGSGTQATLHGPEAIIPLNNRGAAFMREAMGSGERGKQIIHTHVILNGREIAEAVSDDMPSAWRRAGLPA